MAPVLRALAALQAQRGYLFPWVPVMLSLGVGGYFALLVEPGWPVYAMLVVMVALLVMLARRVPESVAPLVTAIALIAGGVLLAGARAHLVAAPVLHFRYYGAVEGRIVTIDRSASDKIRLTLDRVKLDRVSPEDTPARVRVSLHGAQGFITPEPGLRVMLTANLSPPQGPTEPGGFDFRRIAWFNKLGAIGYTRTPVLKVAPPADGAAGLFVHRLRMRISAAVQAALPGESGAFAAAITTGDRSGMGRGTLNDLRASNLSHLLAISGLHMGLLTGFVFAALRLVMVAIPRVGLRWPVKKIAAILSLIAGAFYYALSGGNVATERAFVMVSVMFVAVIFDRRAITLRAVAIAAVIVLCLRPESLTGPGFQMSFSATTALVAVFGALRDWRGWRAPKILRPVLAVVVSSAVAGLATAPVAAAHFNRIADYGLIANLLSVPLMGAVVMPAAVLTALLTPLGLAWVGLAIMQPAIDWILGVAHWVAGLDGSITPVIAPAPTVLPVFALGMLWLILWRGRARFAGLVPAAFAFVLWSQTERPPVLISESARLVGVLTEAGRALNKPKGDGFTAMSWLENDGDTALQLVASERSGIAGVPGTQVISLNGQKIVHLSGRGADTRVAEACRTADLVILAKDVTKPPGCVLLNEKNLRKTGALAIYPNAGSLRLIGAKDIGGTRLWSGQ